MSIKVIINNFPIKIKFRLSVFPAFLFLFLGTLKAEPPHTKAEILSDVMTVQPGTPFNVAVRLKMDPEWHTYWKNPGDSGMATRITWVLPEGFKAGEIEWPNPKRIEDPPLTSFGYTEEVYLLTKITPPTVIKQSKNIVMKAQVHWLECKDACYPGKAELKLELPLAIENPVPNPDNKGNFSLAQFQLPLQKSDWGIQSVQDDKNIAIELMPPSWFKFSNQKILFYPSKPALIENASAQSVFQKDGKLILVIPKAATSTEVFANLEGSLVADFGWTGPQTETGLDLNVPMPKGQASMARPMAHSDVSLWLALLLAFAGGVLLNLMPCVLPVLSIKVVGFLKHGEDQRDRVIHGLQYLLGVLISFWGLAGALQILRKSGEAIGWGFQLQSAPFVTFLAVLFFLMALNLFGLFEVGLTLTRLGDAGPKKSKGISSFVSGVLATVVATPCTAPFMGSALGYALTVGPVQSLLVFTSLGLGMGIPYVVLSASPKLINLFPKPGPWMDTLKQLMGFLLMATVLWLVWVLEKQARPVSIMMLVLLVVGASAWCYGRFQKTSGKKSFVWAMFSLLFILSAASASVKFTRMEGEKLVESNGKIEWKVFSKKDVEADRKDNRAVFIDFTAAWCLTCQVNERIAFSSQEIADLIKNKNISTYKADWTSYDAAITDALHEYGRDGVPVYVFYLPGQSDPILLPTVLTPGLLKEQFEKIKS